MSLYFPNHPDCLSVAFVDVLLSDLPEQPLPLMLLSKRRYFPCFIGILQIFDDCFASSIVFFPAE